MTFSVDTAVSRGVTQDAILFAAMAPKIKWRKLHRQQETTQILMT